MRKFIVKLGLAVLLLAAAGGGANAQSTVWNTPSTDALEEGATLVEADFLTHFGRAAAGGFRTYGVRVVRGTGRGTEIGVNAFVTRAGGETLPVEIQPNAKWNFYENEKYGVKAAAGVVGYLPVSKLRGGADAFGMVYSTVSKKIRRKYGPRLTGGLYGLVAAKNGGGDRAGATVAVEQPVTARVTFLADWFSGKNRFGYVGAGVGLATSKKSSLYVGYNAGNAGRGNNYLGVFYSYTF